MRRSFAALTAAMLLAAPLAAGTASATTPPDSHLSVFTSLKKVTSSSGKTLFVALELYQDVTSGSKTSGARVDVEHGNVFSSWGSYEEHDWTFNLPNADVSFDKSTGKVTVNTHTDISPFGSANMVFKPTSTSMSCHQQDTREQGALSGAFHFNTNTKLWGRVGSNNFSFGKAGADRFVDKGFGECGSPPPPTPRCYKDIQWYGPNDLPVNIAGSSSSAGSVDQLSRNVDLGAPAGATRRDVLQASVPAPTLDATTGTLSITTGGAFSGSATIDNGTLGSPDTFECTKNGALFTQTLKNWYNADWTSPSNDLFTASFQITPDVSAPQSDLGGSSIFRDTYA